MRGFSILGLVCCMVLPARGQPVSEQMFVKIGGILQWITIEGTNRNNPVVLFLHGGPGDALSPFADAMYAGWERDFTLVQWDQRGAGRTYSKNGPAIGPSMTMDRMIRDGIEVARFLIRRLQRKKIIIVGGSWGSILGIHMAHARPDLFHAYVGVAQMVNWQQNLAASYARVVDLARSAGDQEAVAALTQLAAPPWHAVAKWPVFRKWEQKYQAKLLSAPRPSFPRSPMYASPAERSQYEEADDFSFLHFWGPALSGPLTTVDLPALGTNFSIPIFMIQGEEDLTAVPELAKTYFDSLKAPRKQFFLVPGTGHEDSVAELNLTREILTEQVRPLALH